MAQVIEFRWAQLVWERFSQRNLQFLGSEYMPCGHLPSASALVFVENHDRQSNCHVPDPEAPCISLTYQDGELYKVRRLLSPSCLRNQQTRYMRSGPKTPIPLSAAVTPVAMCTPLEVFVLPRARCLSAMGMHCQCLHNAFLVGTGVIQAFRFLSHHCKQ